MSNPPDNCPLDSTDCLRNHGRREADDHAVRIALLEQGMAAINVQLKGINSNIGRLVWLVLVAVVGALLKLIIMPGVA